MDPEPAIVKCPNCAYPVPAEREYCPSCHTRVVEDEAPGEDLTPLTMVEGRFVKARVEPVAGYGRYRGRGRLELRDEALHIEGRHVYPLAARWVVGLGIFFASIVATLGLLALGLVAIYLIVEYAWLKREDLDVPYTAITGLTTDAPRGLVAVGFDGREWCSPVVLRCRDWIRFAIALRARVGPAVNG
jgi:hypothetical protein